MSWQLILCVVVGAVLGFLAGLGVGGGSLLILWLTLVQNTDSSTARVINLMFFLPCAVTALIFRTAQQKVPWKHIFPGILAGCVGAGIFSFLGRQWDLAVLKKLFGILLLVTGLREVMYRPGPQHR